MEGSFHTSIADVGQGVTKRAVREGREGKNKRHCSGSFVLHTPAKTDRKKKEHNKTAAIKELKTIGRIYNTDSNRENYICYAPSRNGALSCRLHI